MAHKRLLTLISAAILLGLCLVLSLITLNLLMQASSSKNDRITRINRKRPPRNTIAATYAYSRQQPDSNDLQTLKCEHGRLLIDCNECRTIVGLPILDPEFLNALKQADDVEVQENSPATLDLIGDVHLDLTRVVEISSTTGGHVESIHKAIGQTVAASDILAIIQSPELGQAQLDFLANQALLNLADQTFQQQQELYDLNRTTQAEFLIARDTLAVAKASAEAAQRTLQLLGITEEQIKALAETGPDENLGRLALTTPIPGTILQERLVRGQPVRTTDTLYRIADLASLWVYCDTHQSDIQPLQENLAAGRTITASIYATAFPDSTFKATLDMIESKVDYASNTVIIRLTADNSSHKLKPGMYVAVKINIPPPLIKIHPPETNQ